MWKSCLHILSLFWIHIAILVARLQWFSTAFVDNHWKSLSATCNRIMSLQLLNLSFSGAGTITVFFQAINTAPQFYVSVITNRSLSTRSGPSHWIISERIPVLHSVLSCLKLPSDKSSSSRVRVHWVPDEGDDKESLQLHPVVIVCRCKAPCWSQYTMAFKTLVGFCGLPPLCHP